MNKTRTIILAMIAGGSFVLAIHFAWDGLTHHGNGVWLYGGDVPGTGGQITTNEFWSVVSEKKYQRNCFAGTVMFLVVAAGFAYEACKGPPKSD